MYTFSVLAKLNTLHGRCVQVDENLRVEGFSNVFAVGDATNVKETKLGYLAASQVHSQPPAVVSLLSSFSIASTS